MGRWWLVVGALAACKAPCDRPGAICTVAGVSGVSGFNGDDLAPMESWLYQPSALAWAPDGNLVINDYNNFRVRELDGDVLRTTVGVGVEP